MNKFQSQISDYHLYEKSINNKNKKVPYSCSNLSGITVTYDFDSTHEYYDSRPEFDYVVIIDKESSRKKINSDGEIRDEYRIRKKRPSIISKKHETQKKTRN